MKVKFIKDVELEVVTGLRNDVPTTKNELFKAGSELEFDICDELEPPEASEIQFGDGTVSFVTANFWTAVTIIEKD